MFTPQRAAAGMAIALAAMIGAPAAAWADRDDDDRRRSGSSHRGSIGSIFNADRFDHGRHSSHRGGYGHDDRGRVYSHGRDLHSYKHDSYKHDSHHHGSHLGFRYDARGGFGLRIEIGSRHAPPPHVHHVSCSHRKYVSGHYVTRAQQVLVCPQRWETRYVPAVYQTCYDRWGRPSTVLVKPACHENVLIPAVYETRHVQVWAPPTWVEYHVPGCHLHH